jgi:hypothetical protein
VEAAGTCLGAYDAHEGARAFARCDEGVHLPLTRVQGQATADNLRRITAERKLVDLTSDRCNQIAVWLRHIDDLKRTAWPGSLPVCTISLQMRVEPAKGLPDVIG